VRTVFKIAFPLLLIAIGVGVFGLLKATKPEQPPPQVQERVWRVQAERAEPRRLAPELELYGQVATNDLLKAAASASAWVTDVAVRDGDRVAEGQLLLQLDERDFLPRMAQVKAQIAELEAEIASEANRFETDRLALEQEKRLLDLARESVARQQRLLTKNLGAEQALDDAEQAEARQELAVSQRQMNLADHPARLRALEARLARNRAQLEELELEYARATLRAPYDGVVTAVEVTEGDQVAKGAVLVRLYAVESLEVRARIPAPYQAELIRAIAAGVPLRARAEVGGATMVLELDRLAGEAGPSGVDGLFRVAAQGQRRLLRPGQVLNLRMARPQRSEVFAVPFRAVYGGERLYKLEDGRLVGVAIERLGSHTGDDGERRLLVRSPRLQAGDWIVTTHMPNAIDGLRVEVVPGSPGSEDEIELSGVAAPGQASP